MVRRLALSALAMAAVALLAALRLDEDFAAAFCLGAFFCGLLGALFLFGFARMVETLESIHDGLGRPGPPTALPYWLAKLHDRNFGPRRIDAA